MRRLALAASLITLADPVYPQEGDLPPLPGASADDEIVDIRSVPIETLQRVTRADGNVFYVSDDHRWVITGDVIDMWTGEKEHELTGYDRMRWNRTGTSMDEVGLQGWVRGETQPKAALFLTQQCKTCELQALLAVPEIVPAPYGRIDAWEEWGWIWCHERVGLDILDQWRQNDTEDGIQTFKCENGPQAARIAALAQVFDMDPERPTLIDRQGRIARGQEEIAQWAEEHIE